ncbi:PIG-L family deacetylase [Modestobacter marinus]|uniref:PIG-L family deacetylase n=1 Tax=Modestobacter marinus TaxID=477641 RepID=UPI001C970C1C|nr:PIG-L family deacetylase [Modestobacter marinus]
MPAAVLAVVAHPDDDLLFLNPDLDTGIRAGLPTTVVYVTAGQAGLTGTAAADRVRDRQRGVQDAHRVSAGVGDRPLQGEWVGRVVRVAGREVEELRLRDRPAVRLVFLGLPDGQLAALATGATLSTVPAADGLVRAPQPYDAGTTVAVLAALLHRYRPTQLHLTELSADPRYDVPPSHPDHRAAAALAVQAVDRYRTSTRDRLPHVTEHRDYGISQLPVDLDPATREHKRRLFADEYQPWDPAAVDAWGWTDRAYHRHPAGTSWSAVDAGGTLHLVVVRAGRALSWTGDGGSWDGPVDLGADIRAVTTLRRLDGGIHLAARTTDHRVLTRPASGGSWTDLGTPDPGDAARHVGTPVLACNADGRLQVFTVNARGGLSSRWQRIGGGWAEWTDFGDSDLQDPCTAVLDGVGHIVVVAATRTGLVAWRQTGPNGRLARATVPALPPAGPPTLAFNADGRLEVHYRRAGTAAVAVTWQDAVLRWTASTTLDGTGGLGQPATATTSAGTIATAVRDRDGGASVALQRRPNSPYGPWTSLGGQLVDSPIAVATRDGRLVVAAVHADDVLRWRTRKPDGTWTPWADIG